MLFSKGKLVLIPDSAEIVLHGMPRDARCAMISGRILLLTRTARMVSSLVVRFRPKQEDLLNPAMSIANLSEITCTVVKDGRTGPTSQETPFNQQKRTQEWRFSMGIPGNINESVFSPSAFIAYELVAELRTSSVAQWAPFCKLTATVPIAVKRTPAAESALTIIASESMNVGAKWRDRIELTAMAASRIVHDSRPLHISGVVRPLLKGMRLLRAGFEIREFIEGPFDSSSSTPTRGNTVTRCSRDINAGTLDTCQDGVYANMQFPPSTVERRSGVVVDQEIQISGILRIPHAYNEIQYDIAIGPIRVSHELVFAVSVVDEIGQVHNVRLSSGIYVFPYISTEVIDLPRYENSDKDVLLAAGQCWTLDSSAPQAASNLQSPWTFSNRSQFFDHRPPPEYTPSIYPARTLPTSRPATAPPAHFLA
ncbi:hypothetical protein LPJ64_002597 [Coemansia asiatica]|uniref:Arrestin-like N-terminal domain-containing protein n=1 Tax=Coemansia asiatica TaxID=1052880 RepID=A0A9W7XMM0_9FUNG|nr:hypothetical protein LPJ64_002597 [Coemansia asiatica]